MTPKNPRTGRFRSRGFALVVTLSLMILLTNAALGGPPGTPDRALLVGPSTCRFTYPEDARRALLILFPNADKKGYRADVINPVKMKFTKGSTLLVNYRTTHGTVMRNSVLTNEPVLLAPDMTE